jgi:superfamily I DNA and/or RNA helicase
MTTTCASRYHSIIKDIAPSVLIVEEAAMVFEYHVVALLNKNIQHLLLIGDHKQLKALSKVHEFCVDYKIDQSLFERLLNNDYPKIMLNCQHRSNSALSWLLKHFYDVTIIDHPSVLKIEPIRGISKNIYIINHRKEEFPVDFSKKK